MTQNVTLPDGTVNTFPDEATPDMIAKALKLSDKPAEEQQPQPSTPVVPPEVPMANVDNQGGWGPKPIASDPVDDKIFQQSGPGQVMDSIDKWMGLSKPREAAFKAYSDVASEPLGLSEETQQKLRESGWFNDYEKGDNNWAKSVAESLLKPAAVTLDAAIRGPESAIAAVVTGAGNLVAQEEPEIAARHGEDLINFIFINSGFSEVGLPKEINPEARTVPTATGERYHGDLNAILTPTATPSRTLAAEGPPIPTLNVAIPKDSAILDKTGNLNLDYIKGDTNAKDILGKTAQAYAEKNGEVVTNAETSKQAQKFLDDAMTQSANGIPDVLANYHRADPVNRNLLGAARQLVVQSTSDYLTLAKKATETGLPADTEAATAAYQKLENLQGIRHEISAEAGRVTQSHQIVVGEDGMETVADKLTSAKLPPEDVHKIAATLDTPQQIAKFAKDAQKPTFSDGLIYYVINNYLSGPITHAAYAASFAAQTMLRVGVETPVAVLVGKAQKALKKTLDPKKIVELQDEATKIKEALEEADSTQGRKLQAAEAAMMSDRLKEITTTLGNARTVMPGEVGARFYGIGEGYLDAVKASWKAFKSGTIEKLPGENMANNLNFGNNPIVAFGKNIGNPVLSAIVQTGGQMVGIPSRFVGSIHTFQKFLAYSESLNALVYRQAASEGLEGDQLGARIAQLKNDPPLDIMQAATDEGKYASLIGEPGETGKKFEEWAHSSPYIRAVVPFSRVMNNLNSQTFLERTPLGALAPGRVQDAILGRSGNAAQAVAIGKMATGVAVLGGGAALTAKGLANGGMLAQLMQHHAEDEDGKKQAIANIRAFNYLSGNPPYSVRFGDTNVAMRFLGIPGRLLAFGSDLHDVHQSLDDGDAIEATGLLAAAVGNDILSESSLRGVAELYDAIDSARRGDYGPSQNYAYNALTSAFMPASVGMGQVARMEDPYLRLTKSTPLPNDAWYSQTLRRFQETVQAKTPFLSQDLVPKVDIFGNPLKRDGDHAWAERDPVMQALHQLEIFPAPVGTRLGNVKLTEQQQADYATKAGTLFYMNMHNKVSDPRWASLDGQAQTDIVYNTIDNSRNQARCYMNMQYPDLAARCAKNKLDILDKSE